VHGKRVMTLIWLNAEIWKGLLIIDAEMFGNAKPKELTLEEMLSTEGEDNTGN
jgi:hypothetical protein